MTQTQDDVIKLAFTVAFLFLIGIWWGWVGYIAVSWWIQLIATIFVSALMFLLIKVKVESILNKDIKGRKCEDE